MTARAVLVLLAALAGAAAAQEATMIHAIDGKFLGERANESRVLPGGLVTVMSFPDRDGTLRAHTITADDGAFDVPIPPPAARDAWTIVNFTAPTRPGNYTFHSKLDEGMRGTLVVVGTPPAAGKATPGAGALLAAGAIAGAAWAGRARRR